MDTLAAQLAAGHVDGPVLEELALTVSALDSGQVAQLREALLPSLVQLGSRAPASLVVALLRDISLDEALAYAPQLRVTGTNEEDDLIVGLIASKITSPEAVTTHADLVKSVIDLVSVPEVRLATLAQAEKLAGKLAHWHCLAQFVPFEQLYTGGTTLQARLLKLDLLLAKNGDLSPQNAKWATFPLDPEDELANMLLIDYYGELVGFLPASRLDFLDSVFHSMAQRLSENSPILEASLERTLAQLGRKSPSKFMVLDSQYSLVQANRRILMAQLPAAYVGEHHPSVVKRLELTDSSLPIFANLVADPVGYQLLDMPAGRVNKLTTQSKLELAVAATSRKDIANLFVSRFPALFDALAEFEPPNFELADLKRLLQSQLRDIGVRLVRRPAVATTST